jgi:hypothetical protein
LPAPPSNASNVPSRIQGVARAMVLRHRQPRPTRSCGSVPRLGNSAQGYPGACGRGACWDGGHLAVAEAGCIPDSGRCRWDRNLGSRPRNPFRLAVVDSHQRV